MSDISLIKDFIDGDDESGLLYNKYVKDLFSYGISLGFPREICMDAIHDVFCKLYYLKDENIATIKNVKHYLFASLKNRLLDIYKKNKNLNIAEDLGEMPFEIEVSVLDAMIDEEDRDLIIKKVESLMNCLTERQKEAIYLRYIQEMDYEEIASLLNMTTKSSRMLVFRAMEKMRDFTSQEKKLFFILLLTHLLKNF